MQGIQLSLRVCIEYTKLHNSIGTQVKPLAIVIEKVSYCIKKENCPTIVIKQYEEHFLPSVMLNLVN